MTKRSRRQKPSKASQEKGPLLSNEERGRKSYGQGRSFELQVEELYRLLRYDVEHGRLFSGRQVDLLLTARLGDLTLYRAIECKAGPVTADHIDSFIAKLKLVRKEYPSAQGTIVSATSFSDAIKSHAHSEGIQLTLHRDLAAQLFDGHAYAQALIRDCEAHERYPLDLYIESKIGLEASGDSLPALEFISQWLQAPDWNQLTILGDVGTGKSFLSRVIAYQLATAFLKGPLKNPLPILIDLRNADRQFSLEGLILTHLVQNGLGRVSFEALQHSLAEGNVVLIFDGFDEMAARVTPQVTTRNFHELARCVKGRAKVLLTCRTHYFKSRTEEEEVILGSGQGLESEMARDLYFELISRKGFRIAYLKPFEVPQIEEYVRKVRPDTAPRDLYKIRATYNLMELSQRPMLLEMIVKSIDKLTAGEINPATLYAVYTDAWIHRDKWRDVLSPSAKLGLLMALATSLWKEDLVSIHHTRLLEYVEQELATQIQNPQQLVEIDNEIRTASFLTRDQSGHYGFAHKSYSEFFIAKHLAAKLTAGELGCFQIRRLSPEVIGFLRHLVDLNVCEDRLAGALCEAYRPFISENMLLCLYGLRREVVVAQQDSSNPTPPLSVPLPSKMQLSGAQLDQVTLEGADLSSADLENANLSQAILAGANLANANLTGTCLEKADLRRACMRAVSASAVRLTGGNLDGADLSNGDFSSANCRDAFLLNITHRNTLFEGANFVGAIVPDSLRQAARQDTSASDRTMEKVFGVDGLPFELENRIAEIYHLASMYAQTTRLGTNDDFQDTAQETVFRLVCRDGINKMQSMNGLAWRNYVRLVVRDVVTSRQRANKEVPFSQLTGGSIESVPSSDADPLEAAMAVESVLAKTRTIAAIRRLLSPQSWRVMKARYVDHKKLSDIAKAEGLSERTVQRLITKGQELVSGAVTSG